MCLTASSHKQFENETKKSRNEAKLKTTILITIKTNKVVEWSGRMKWSNEVATGVVDRTSSRCYRFSSWARNL